MDIIKFAEEMEIRKWRNAFYGLPPIYRPDSVGVRKTNVDVKCLFKAAKKHRLVYAR